MLFVYSCAELQASQYSCTWGGYASYTSACGKFLNALCVYSGMNWGQISPDKIESKRFKLASIQVQIDKHSPIYYACCLARWNTRWWNDPPTFLRITLRSYVKPQVWLRLFTPINFSHFLKFHCLGTQIISTYFEVVVLDGRFDIVPCVPKINTLSELHKKLSSRFITIPVHFFFFSSIVIHAGNTDARSWRQRFKKSMRKMWHPQITLKAWSSRLFQPTSSSTYK